MLFRYFLLVEWAYYVILGLTIMNSLILMVADFKNEKRKDYMFNNISESIIMTGLAIYIFMLIDYFIVKDIKNTVIVFIFIVVL